MSSLKVSKKVMEIPQQRKRDSTTVGDDNVDSPPNVYRCANVKHYVTLCKTGFWSVWSPWLKTLLPLVLFNPSKSFVLLLFLENPANLDAPNKLTLGDFLSKLCFLCLFVVLLGFLRCLPLCPRSIYYALTDSQRLPTNPVNPTSAPFS